MEGLNLLLNGFASALTLTNLIACFVGALIGTIVGVLRLKSGSSADDRRTNE